MALNLVGTSGNATIDADTGISGFTIDFDVWTTATRPASPSTGDTGFNSDLNCLETYNGSAWVSQLPSQSGNNGKYLTTNGTSPSWATIDALPSQTGNNGKYLTTNGSVASWAAVAGGPEWQTVQTGNFNATAGKAYPINTTSASVTVTLPASPTAGQQIILTDYAGTWAANNAVVNSNGNKVNGVTGSGNLNTNYSTCSLVYIDSTQGWISYSNVYPLFGPGTVEYLVIAGGGGGGSTRGGGGGAGGFRTATGLSVSPGSAITVTVGAGGAGAIYTSGGVSQGSDSVFSSITSTGGGYGRGRYESGASGSPNGGSGGGGSEAGGSSTAGTGISGQGYAGGNSFSTHGGGGGGAFETGYNTGNGNGGAGLSSSISGTLTYYAGGGGGGAYSPSTGGTGGTGGGGNGGNTSQAGFAGTANTGGGGGGGGDNQNGGAGGSGIVIIRYSSSLPAASSTTGSPTVTVTGGYRIYQWTSSGSITF